MCYVRLFLFYLKLLSIQMQKGFFIADDESDFEPV